MPKSDQPGKVISIKTRMPVELTEALEKAENEAIAAVEELDRRNCTDLLDATKELIDKGKLTGLIVLGIDPETGLFFNQARLDGPYVYPHMLFAYVGQLQALAVELTDAAMNLSAYIDRDGSIVTPDEPDDEDEE